MSFYVQYNGEDSGGGSGAAGVSSLNGLTGDLTLVEGAGISILAAGTDITISMTPNQVTTSFGVCIDAGAIAIEAGAKAYVTIPYNCEIQSWTLVADQVGDIVIDVKKADFATFPATSSIAGKSKKIPPKRSAS
jgi:hypothetical protein